MLPPRPPHRVSSCAFETWASKRGGGQDLCQAVVGLQQEEGRTMQGGIVASSPDFILGALPCISLPLPTHPACRSGLGVGKAQNGQCI